MDNVAASTKCAISLPDIKLIPGKFFHAQATHLCSPHEFYVVPSPYVDIMKKIETPGKPSKPSQEGSIVIFYSHIKNEFVRGIIMHFDASGILIHAIDRGFEESVQAHDIYEPIEKSALNLPALCYECELYLCEPRNGMFTDEQINYFNYFMKDYDTLRIRVQSLGKKLKVVVYSSQSIPDDVATTLALMDVTCLGMSNLNLNPAPQPQAPKYNWTYTKLQIGQTLTVRMQEGSSLQDFYVCTEDDFKDYLKTKLDFHLYCLSQPQIRPEQKIVGAPVGILRSLFDKYERGIILKKLACDTFQVRLIDWGVEVLVNSCRLKAITTGLFCQTPARAIYCSATNAGIWDNELERFLHKGYAFNITILGLGDWFTVPFKVEITKK